LKRRVEHFDILVKIRRSVEMVEVEKTTKKV
jgi:hypothetical protein